MALHLRPDAVAMAARPRVGRRRLTNEPDPRSGVLGVTLRFGLGLLAAGLLLLIVSTLAMVADSETALFAFAAGAAAVVSGTVIAAISAR